MKEYHKIKTVFKRDPENNYKTLLMDDFAIPEFKYLQNNYWVFTEKVDGTNIRVMWHHENALEYIPIKEMEYPIPESKMVLEIRGKTDKAQRIGDLNDNLEKHFTADKMQEIFSDTPVCLYGEGYGAKIQKGGGNYRQDQGFVLFDVKIDEWWLKRKDIEDIAKQLEIDVVPILGFGTLEHMVDKVKVGFNSMWGNFRAEGIVARPEIELKTRSGERIITKIKHKDF